MSRIFLSHSSTDAAAAVALGDWLADNGWNDEIFLELDPQRGIAAGERWERALKNAANRCEAVLFLVSKAWLNSVSCLKEFNLAHRLNKRLFGVLIEDIPLAALPANLISTWQSVRLAAGRDHVMLRVVLPVTHQEAHVTFSAEGLQRLKHALEQTSLDPRHFAWPPQSDPHRPPYRGLRALEPEDAGIFFGRDGPILEALDRLRGIRETTPSRLLAILGGSGAGKSSFLRAGLFPRLKRDDRNFLPLQVIRPQRAAISGETGLLSSLEAAFAAARIPIRRADLRAVIQAGAAELKPLLRALAEKVTPVAPEGDTDSKPPTLVLSIDQAEELFLAEAQGEARPFLGLLRDLIKDDAPAITAVFTTRSENYERLQLAPELEGVHQDMLSLPPMPRRAYAEVIKEPVRRLPARALDIEDALVDALLTDIDAGGAKDALPLLAFTLEHLYGESHSDGSIKLAQYHALGGIKGSIEAATERALQAADADPAVPKDRVARLKLLRRGLIPWLAGIDSDTGAPRRRVARLSEIPAEARPLIQHLVEQRLLATDVDKGTGELTIEPVHEALLRQWGLLEGWLTADAGQIAVLEAAAAHQLPKPQDEAIQPRSSQEMLRSRSERERPRADSDRIALPLLDDVDCSVFGPSVVRCGKEVLVQVFLHIPADAGAALGLAITTDASIDRQITHSLNIPIKRGTNVQIFFDPGGLLIPSGASTDYSLLWRGRLTSCAFRVKAPITILPQDYHPAIRVSAGGELVGCITLKLRSSLFARPGPPLLSGLPRTYRNAFVSYASKDRYEVLKRTQALRAAITVRQDILDLDPGARWEAALYQWIDEADLFLLCWSDAARRSSWVMKEARYALKRQRHSGGRSPDIIPLVLEPPPYAQPPRWLAHLHFNDRLCSIIAAEQP